ncbi:beta-hydroxyacyl-ACP dehydratase [Belnapia sp. T6]|uniref:Beta-hydroxyacyl-ACP dehydratase n=1 Tax=Belnapia mucosa TaxID=2804532 RepID=A0ABS1V9M5_9PROT|nr:beta-hydroxyacyl-ACP dehydratase [Belnapia mucosa]MBL6457043.1 beta-hydroxyacyl-ACP dehydratase [Belnapia mucosa]
MSTTTTRFLVPPEHPALPGHFPGRPILPGVVLLDAVLQAAGLGQAHLLRAKFTAPVLPGDAVEIALSPRAGGRIGFTCTCRDVTVLSGELACSPAP